MRSFVLSIAAVALTLAGAAHADTCSRQAIAHAAANVLNADRTLSAIPTSDDMPIDVSHTARKAISAMKDRLNDYTDATLRCASAEIEAKGLQRTLAGLAGVKLPQTVHAKNWQPGMPHYGGGPIFNVRRLAAGVVGVEATLGIACGEDTMLMIFERRNDRWSETLRTQSTPYKTVAGGWMAFEYAISPIDKYGHRFIVTKNIAPWCSSVWSEIRYQVLRPGAEAAHPRSLLAKTGNIWWSDNTGVLKVDASGFDLRWRAESIDGDVHNREWIAHYVVDGDRTTRTAPVAESPRDFADEWIRLPWPEAKNWTAISSYGLKPLHDQLRKQHYFTYVSVRRCDQDQTQIEVQPVADDTRHVFFQVAGGKVPMMRDVTFSANPRCKGPNLYNADHPQQ